jgi:hypothetical protein
MPGTPIPLTHRPLDSTAGPTSFDDSIDDGSASGL